MPWCWLCNTGIHRGLGTNRRKDDPMRIRLWLFMALLAMVLAFGVRPLSAAQPEGDPKDKAVLQRNGEAFGEAFHKGDAKARAAFWTADGDYTDENGHHMKGPGAI